MAHASKLQANMLIAHSSMDENVHIQNTMQMLTAFINAGKDVDLRIFPKGAHGVAYNQQSYLLLHQAYTNYLNRHLSKGAVFIAKMLPQDEKFLNIYLQFSIRVVNCPMG